MNDDNLSLQDLGFLPENIETLFKAEPPVEQVKNGYGYLGVVLRDTEKDLIQCHICGKWCRSIGHHIRLAHKIDIRSYRIRFGLPLSYPLISRSYSKNLSNGFKKRKIRKYLKTSGRKKYKRTKIEMDSHRYGSTSPAAKNKKGICDEQIDRRYLIVCDMVGRQARQSDLKEHDPSLPSAIKSRYKSFNKYLSVKGFDIIREIKRYTNKELLDYLKLFHKKHGRVPTADELRNTQPNSNTMSRRFGSYINALKAAGLVSVNESRLYSDDNLIALIVKASKTLNKIPKQKDICKLKEYPHPRTIRERFGSWNRALAAADLI